MAPLAISMNPLALSEGGMYLWAGIITIASLIASYFVAMGWQVWRARRRA